VKYVERESHREQYVERETVRAIRRVVERDNQSKGLVTTDGGERKVEKTKKIEKETLRETRVTCV
jgi:hypothetical protein